MKTFMLETLYYYSVLLCEMVSITMCLYQSLLLYPEWCKSGMWFLWLWILLSMHVKVVRCMLWDKSTQFVKVMQWRKHVTSICDASPGEVFRRLPSSSCMDNFNLVNIKYWLNWIVSWSVEAHLFSRTEATIVWEIRMPLTSIHIVLLIAVYIVCKDYVCENR